MLIEDRNCKWTKITLNIKLLHIMINNTSLHNKNESFRSFLASLIKCNLFPFLPIFTYLNKYFFKKEILMELAEYEQLISSCSTFLTGQKSHMNFNPLFYILIYASCISVHYDEWVLLSFYTHSNNYLATRD